jgi:membrane protein
MFALSLQVFVSAADAVIERLFPRLDIAIGLSAISRIGPTLILFCALQLLFMALTPSAYRSRRFPKWPGALFIAVWWFGTAQLLPLILAHLTAYSLTYGGLAGTMVTLIFFFIIGLGVVIGAELNAALAEFPAEEAPADETEE